MVRQSASWNREYLQHVATRYLGVIVALGISLVIWAAGLLGLFSIPEGIIYDLFISAAPRAERADSAVLLIEAPDALRYGGEETWLALLDRLEGLGTRSVVFTSVPTHVSGRFPARARRMGNVVLGVELPPPGGGPGRPASAGELPPKELEGVPCGVVERPPDEHGISRSQRLRVTAGGRQHRTLEAAVAEQVLARTLAAPDPFIVNFVGRPRLPRVSLERVLDGGLVEELVRGKTVLIGFEQWSGAPWVHGPYFGGDRELSLAEFQGHAINTLVLGKAIVSPGPLAGFVIILAFSVIMAVAVNVLGLRGATRAAALLVLTALLLSWGALMTARVWAPAAQVVAAQVVTAGIVLRKRTVFTEQSANLMLLDMSVKLREYVLPESFYSSQEYWSQVITMLNHMLDLNRSIFLEKIENDHRVHEVKALNCSFQDIHEKRRDYERHPYSTAIQEGGPIRLGSSVYLKKIDQPEEQYLVPLVFGGETIGFWAFGIAPEKIADVPMFDSFIKTFAYQISELLYRRQQWRRMTQQQEGLLQGYAAVGYDPQHHELRKSIELLGRRLLLLESLYSTMDVAVALFDVFGRVMLVNQKMLDVLRDTSLAPYEMTAIDLAAAISGEPHDRLKTRFYDVILHHQTVLLTSAFGGEAGGAGILNIKPVLCVSRANELHIVCPFDTYGILFELYDRDKMEVPGFPAADAEPAGELQESCADSLSILREVAAGMQGSLADKGLSLQIGHGPSIPAVIVDLENLRELMRLIMVMLVRDAVEGTELVITVRTGREEVSYMFSDRKGIGMPQEVFAQYVAGERASSTPELARLREVARRLEMTGATMEASSGVGAGMRFIIRLKTTDGGTDRRPLHA